MKLIFQIILLSILLYSCTDKHAVPDTFKYDTEVIAVFTPNGIGDQSASGLMYKGMVRTADELGISFRPVFPLTYEEGAETIARLAGEDQDGRKRLIISTDPGYSDHLSKSQHSDVSLILNRQSFSYLMEISSTLTYMLPMSPTMV